MQESETDMVHATQILTTRHVHATIGFMICINFLADQFAQDSHHTLSIAVQHPHADHIGCLGNAKDGSDSDGCQRRAVPEAII